MSLLRIQRRGLPAEARTAGSKKVCRLSAELYGHCPVRTSWDPRAFEQMDYWIGSIVERYLRQCSRAEAKLGLEVLQLRAIPLPADSMDIGAAGV